VAVVIRVSDKFLMCPRLVVSAPGPSLFVLSDRGENGRRDGRAGSPKGDARPPAGRRALLVRSSRRWRAPVGEPTSRISDRQ
jgi:hypothetical protein